MNRAYTREELEGLTYEDLKKLSAELELEGARIKKQRHYFIEEFWKRMKPEALKASELGEGEITGVRVGNTPILFAKVAGKIYAFNDRCPHKGFPLHKGSLEGHTLTCAYHGGKFDIRDGRCLKHPYETYPCRRFEVTVSDGVIECK
jgi:3-phenylpropionate/trans-cinnamate dioxygenase ferredoxin component